MSAVKALPKKLAGQYVDTKHVDMLLSTYKKERWVANSEKLGKLDSLSAWYGIEELNEFIRTAQKHGADGIRMYFGVYPETFNKVPEFAGRQTIVMVATKDKTDANGNTISKHIYRQTEEGMQLLAFNMSNLCPPICNSTGPGSGSDFPYPIENGVGLAIIDDKEDGLIVI